MNTMTIHSLRNSVRYRCKSQNTNEYLTSFRDRSVLSRNYTQIDDKIHLSKPMNILVNGKNISEICSSKKRKNSALNQRINGQETPKKLSNLKQYIYKKYLTDYDEQLNPNVEGIIRLKQIFDHKNRGKSCSVNKQQIGCSQPNFLNKKPYISKIIGTRNPDIYAMTYINKMGKYREKFASQRKYFRANRQKNLKKNTFITYSNVYQQSDEPQMQIQPWETE